MAVGVGRIISVGMAVLVAIGGIGVGVGGVEVEVGTHPLIKTVRNANINKTDQIDFFM
jgi:hypothetical protein